MAEMLPILAFALLLAAGALLFFRSRRKRISKKSSLYKKAIGKPAPVSAPAPMAVKPAPVSPAPAQPGAARAAREKVEKTAVAGKLRANLTKVLLRKTTLPRSYERGLVTLYKTTGLPGSADKREFLLPWVVMQARESLNAPPYAQLKDSEIRLVELAYHTISAGDRAFTALREEVTPSERAFIDQIRPMALGNAREVLDFVRGGDQLRSRLERVIA